MLYAASALGSSVTFHSSVTFSEGQVTVPSFNVSVL